MWLTQVINLITIVVILWILYYKYYEKLAGHLRTDRILWQYKKRPEWKGWPSNGYHLDYNKETGMQDVIDINTGKSITNWNPGWIDYPPRMYQYEYSQMMAPRPKDYGGPMNRFMPVRWQTDKF